VPSSTWYKRQSPIKEDGRSNNKGRPIVGYTINPDGSVILDVSIVSALKKIRTSEFFENGGGYHKLTHYLRRDYSLITIRSIGSAKITVCCCHEKRRESTQARESARTAWLLDQINYGSLILSTAISTERIASSF